jgi:hypothetical protein
MRGRLHAPAALPRGRARDSHWLRGWLNPEAGLDDVDKRKFLTLPGLELRPPSVAQSVATRYTDCAIPAPAETSSIK